MNIKKEDYCHVAISTCATYLVFYLPSTFEINFSELTEIDISGFIPLNDVNCSALSMVYPEFNIEIIKELLNRWDNYCSLRYLTKEDYYVSHRDTSIAGCGVYSS